MTNDLKYAEEIKEDEIERCVRLGAQSTATKPRKIYLAAPYSARNADGSLDQDKMLKRFRDVNSMAGQLIKSGLIVFSPISHSHPIGLILNEQLNHDMWMAQDIEFIKWADEVWVYKLTGWNTSSGVTREIELAAKLCKPVRYIED